MLRFFIIILFIYSNSLCQPKEEIEFELNTISGYILDNVNTSPIIDIKVEVLSGNNLVKDSTFSDENGFYSIENVGYVWKPKIRFSHRDYRPHSDKLLPTFLDSNNNVYHDAILTSIPNNQKIKSVPKSSLVGRAESFFTAGNNFYHLSKIDDQIESEQIIIKSMKAIENKDGYLLINVNDQFYDPVRCYVPQIKKYENLASIMSGYFKKPYFKNSKLPKFLPNNLLRPSIIYGTVFNFSTKEPIAGAEVRILNSSKRRITAKDGKFAFEVDKIGTYQILVEAPMSLGLFQQGKTEILVNNSHGGWFLSHQYLKP